MRCTLSNQRILCRAPVCNATIPRMKTATRIISIDTQDYIHVSSIYVLRNSDYPADRLISQYISADFPIDSTFRKVGELLHCITLYFEARSCLVCRQLGHEKSHAGRSETFHWLSNRHMSDFAGRATRREGYTVNQNSCWCNDNFMRHGLLGEMHLHRRRCTCIMRARGQPDDGITGTDGARTGIIIHTTRKKRNASARDLQFESREPASLDLWTISH